MNTQLLNRRITVIALLGFASGLPLALSDSTLQAWLTEEGVEIATIGFFSLVGIPYVFKFLWAPMLDRFQPGWPGRRRDWTLVTQIALAVLLAYAGITNMATGPLLWLGIVAVAIAFMSASQDIAIDAYRTEILTDKERGFGAAVHVIGYRVAMLASGAGAFILADHYGFPNTYLIMSGLLLIGIVANIAAPGVPEGIAVPRTLQEAVMEPFRNFFKRDEALMLLALIFLYKIGEAFAGRFTTVFLLRELGFSLTDVGAISKGLGFFATVCGALYGGALMYRLGLYRSLLIFAWLQAVTNLGFCVLAVIGNSYVALVAVIGLENLTGGMGTAAFVALLMAACDRRYTATQYAMLTAVASLGRVFAGPPSGLLVESIGWPVFFFFTFLVALPAIAILIARRTLVESLDVDHAGAT
ncbi:MAG: MFS transporter [Pseudomonadota bacterium]|nr:MFS transporter [Pseudomonadota bacterium]